MTLVGWESTCLVHRRHLSRVQLHIKNVGTNCALPLGQLWLSLELSPMNGSILYKYNIRYGYCMLSLYYIIKLYPFAQCYICTSVTHWVEFVCFPGFPYIKCRHFQLIHPPNSSILYNVLGNNISSNKVSMVPWSQVKLALCVVINHIWAKL